MFFSVILLSPKTTDTSSLLPSIATNYLCLLLYVAPALPKHLSIIIFKCHCKGVGSGHGKAPDGIHPVREHRRRPCGTARDPSHTANFHARDGL